VSDVFPPISQHSLITAVITRTLLTSVLFTSPRINDSHIFCTVPNFPLTWKLTEGRGKVEEFHWLSRKISRREKIVGRRPLKHLRVTKSSIVSEIQSGDELELLGGGRGND